MRARIEGAGAADVLVEANGVSRDTAESSSFCLCPCSEEAEEPVLHCACLSCRVSICPFVGGWMYRPRKW